MYSRFSTVNFSFTIIVLDLRHSNSRGLDVSPVPYFSVTKIDSQRYLGHSDPIETAE